MNERLRWARKAAGFASAAQASRTHGWNAAAYRHHENGITGFRPGRAADYARAFKVSVEWLILGVGPDPTQGAAASSSGGRLVVRQVPIAGEVAAGLWREVPDHSLVDAEACLQVDVQGYNGVALFALRVAGPSMDRIYPEGRWVIAAPPAEVGLQEDDVVVVRRNRSGLVETTLKQLVVLGDGRVALWPRSTHRDFQSPLYITGSEADQDAPEIVGVVVADYARRERPRRPVFLPATSSDERG